MRWPLTKGHLGPKHSFFGFLFFDVSFVVFRIRTCFSPKAGHCFFPKTEHFVDFSVSPFVSP